MSDESTSGPQREQIEAAAEAFDEYLKRAKESLDIERERNALQGKFVQSIQDARDAEEIRLRDLNASLKRLLTASEGTRDAFLDTFVTGDVEAGMQKLQDQLGLTEDESKELHEALKVLNDDFETGADLVGKFGEKMAIKSAKMKQAGIASKGMSSDLKSLAGNLQLGITQSEGLATQIGGLVGNFGSLVKTLDGYKPALIATGFILLATAAETLLGAVNKLGSEFMELTVNSEKARAEIAKFASTANFAADSIASYARASTRYNISAEEQGKAVTGLIENMADLNGSLDAATASIGGGSAGLSDLSAQLIKSGVNAEKMYKNMNIMTRAFNMSTSSSLLFYKDLIENSRIAGQSIEGLTNNFDEASERLLLVSTNSGQLVEEFRKLNGMSRQLGVSISTITDLAGQFDRFDTAAMAVGKLNAQFGLQLSQMEMLRASDEERIEMLRHQFAQTGKNIEQMSKSEKLFLKEALGIKSSADLLKIFGDEQGVNNKNIKNLNTVLEEQTQAWDRLKGALRGAAAAFAPVMTAIVGITNATALFFETLGGLGIVITLGLTVGLFKFVSKLKMVKGAVGGTVDAFKDLRKAVKNAAAASKAADVTGTVMDPKKLADTKESFKGLNSSILEVNKGVGKLNKSLGKMDTTKFNDMNESMSKRKMVEMKAYGIALLALSVAFIALGTGIYIAASGLAILATAMGNMNDNATEFTIVVGILMTSFLLFTAAIIGASYLGVKFSAGLLYLAATVLALGAAAAVAAYGMGSFAEKVGEMGKVLELLAGGKFGTMIDQITKLKEIKSPLANLISDMLKMSAATKDMDGLVIATMSEGKSTIMMASEDIVGANADLSNINVNVNVDASGFADSFAPSFVIEMDGEKVAEMVAKRGE
jgi:hypothetical protein